MHKFNKQIFIVYLVTVSFFLLFQQTYGQTTNEILDQEINLDIKKGTLYQVFSALGSLEEIPTGFEGTTDFNFQTDKIIQIQNGTLREILDSIIKQEPNYTWEIRDGVVNLYPINLRDDNLKTLLETRIKTFSIGKESNRNQISDLIENLEEIKTTLEEKKIRLVVSAWTTRYVTNSATDLEISDADLTTVLNKIVKRSCDSKLWTIHRDSNGTVFLIF